MLILGDWAPGKFIDSVSCEFTADLCVLNLEGPVLTQEIVNMKELESYQNSKVGPLLFNRVLPRFPKPTVYTLANNHFMDFGIDHANTVIELISASESSYVGFGQTRKSARTPLRITYKERKISIFSICEKQYGEATDSTPGVAVAGPWVYKAILEETEKCDFLIVIFHGGLEDTTWSAPWTQDLLRSYVDVGANLVVAHHPHKPQAWENYNGAQIFYSLGNFCIDPNAWKNYPLARYSVGVDLDIVEGKFRIASRFFINSIDSRETSLKVSEFFPSSDHELVIEMEKSKRILENSDLNFSVWNQTSLFNWNLYLEDLLGLKPVSSRFKSNIKNLILSVLARERYKKRKTREIEIHRARLHHAISNESHRELILEFLRPAHATNQIQSASEIVKRGLNHLLE